MFGAAEVVARVIAPPFVDRPLTGANETLLKEALATLKDIICQVNVEELRLGEGLILTLFTLMEVG